MADTGSTYRFDTAPSARDMWGWVARGEVALAIGVVGIVVLLILPIPAFLLDGLLSLSITVVGPDPDDLAADQAAAGVHRPSRPCCWSRPCSAWR